jgi:uncharacterized membrane protein YfcA
LGFETYLLLFCVGIIAGILAGLLGVGGGVVIVPSLITIYSSLSIQNPYMVQTAIATSLFTIIFTAVSSAYKQTKHKNVLWGQAIIIGISSSLSVFLFSKISISLPSNTLKIIFSIVLITMAIKMLTEKTNSSIEENNVNENRNKLFSPVIGILGGIIAAFTGLGGGLFIVPLMHYIQKIPIKKSIGTSSAAIIVTSVSGVISYIINKPPDSAKINYSLGMVDTLAAIPIVLASIPFAQLGVYINKRTNHSLLTKIFGTLLIIIAVKMIFF